jgi:uncharacterized protein with HEPN domain
LEFGKKNGERIKARFKERNEKIRAMRASGMKPRQIAPLFGVTAAYVWEICAHRKGCL